MAKKQSTVTLSLDERLRDSRRQATSLSLPLAIHHRLDLLAELGSDARASRSEILGMLVARATLEAEQIESEILTYRKMTVGDVVPSSPAQGHEETDGAEVIELPLRGPGRPPRRVVP